MSFQLKIHSYIWHRKNVSVCVLNIQYILGIKINIFNFSPVQVIYNSDIDVAGILAMDKRH